MHIRKKDKEITEREKASALKLAESNLKNTFQEELAKKDKEITGSAVKMKEIALRRIFYP